MNESLESPTPKARARVAYGRALLVAGAVAVFLATRAFVYPGVPVLLGGDQGFFWSYADRILHGELPYKDFFQFTPPGADLVFAGAFALFGPRVWVADAVVVALGTALGAVCFRVARQVCSDADAALATAVFTVLVYGQALNATHHWWSVLAIMAGVSVIPPTFTPRRFGGAGALVGVSALFTQSHALAALLAIGAFGAWYARRERLPRATATAIVAALVGGFSAVTVPATAYLVRRVGLAPVWDSLVLHVWRHVREPVREWTFGLPDAVTPASLRWLVPYLVLYAMVPAAYLVTFVRSLGERPSPPEGFYARLLCWSVGTALFLEILPGLTWVRLYGVALPGVILFVWAVQRSARVAWLVRSGVVVMGVMLLRSTYRNHREVIVLPGGQVAATVHDGAKLSWLASRLRRGERVFLADEPSLYLPLDLHNPLFLDAAVPGQQTTPAHVRQAISTLESERIAHVLWPPALNVAEPGELPEGVPALRTYVHDRYAIDRTFPDGDELWERK